MIEPLVSVIVNNYNYGRFLGDAIESCLRQTYSNLEIIAVDDGSIDDSADVMRRYANRIVPIFKANGGQITALNAGFAACHGEVICLLDADDWFLPEKVESILHIFGAHPAIGSCFHAVNVVDASGAALPQPRLAPSGAQDFRKGIARGHMPFTATTTSGLCFRRALLAQICPMPERDYQVQDLYIKWTALALAPTYFLPDALATQRIHGANAYTLKSNEVDRARQFIVCAGWMREQFPGVLMRWADNIFAQGLGTCWRLGDVESATQERVRRYLTGLPSNARSEVLARAVCWRFGVDKLYHAVGRLGGLARHHNG